MKIATSRLVAGNLAAAGIGSAAARLPAIEAELKPIQTYAKLTEAVKAPIVMYKGILNNKVFHDVETALSIFPKGETSVKDSSEREVTVIFGPYSTRGDVVIVKNKEEVKNYDIDVIARYLEGVVLCYGFFVEITEEQAMTGAGSEFETLKRASSLRKLRDNCPTSYTMGYEMGVDYRVFRARALEIGGAHKNNK
ncbi:hypothetical protein OROGR_023586 [Orobanche gracilis]